MYTVIGFSLNHALKSLLGTCIIIICLFAIFAFIHFLYRKVFYKSTFLKRIAGKYVFYTDFISPILLSLTLPLFCVTATFLTRKDADQSEYDLGNLIALSALSLFIFSFYSCNFSLLLLKPFIGLLKDFNADFEVK